MICQTNLLNRPLRVIIVKLKLSNISYSLLTLFMAGLSGYAQGVEGKLKEETTKYEQANAEYMLIEAEKFFLLEDFDRALAYLDKSLEVDNKNHAAYFKKAEIYLAQNAPEKGLEAIKEAINLRKDNKYYYVLGAQLEKANRNMEGAAKFYELMVENTTDYSTYLVELASTYQSLGKLSDAIDVFEKAGSLNLDQSMKLVEMYVQNSKERRATQLMEELIIQYPGDSDLKYQYANLLATVGETDKAIEALEAEPNKTAEMRLLLSNLYAGNGQADAKYSLLIESFSDQDATLTDKTLLLGQLILENPEELPVNLIDSLQTNLELQYPEDALAIENGTFVYSKLAEVTEGNQRDLFQLKTIEKYKKLKDLKPGDFKVWDKVLSYEYKSGDWEALSADADEALMLYPNQAVFYIYLASAKINQKEVDEAEDLLNQASRMSRSNELLRSQILGKQAEVAQLNGNITVANQLYEQALTLGQIHPETSLSYGKFIANYDTSHLSTEFETTQPEDTTETTKPQARSKELDDIYKRAIALYFQSDYDKAFILLLSNIHTFEDNKDGAAVELYGDIYYRLKLPDIAMKYWVKAKEFGGTSDKIDQKIASGKIN